MEGTTLVEFLEELTNDSVFMTSATPMNENFFPRLDMRRVALLPWDGILGFA